MENVNVNVLYVINKGSCIVCYFSLCMSPGACYNTDVAVPSAMGVDPWVDRWTPCVLPPSRHRLLFEELLILTETPCIGVHCSNFHEI